MLSLLRQHPADISPASRLNVRYGSMAPTSLSLDGRHQRAQPLRQNRDLIGGAANEDTSAPRMPERSLLGVVHRNAGPLQAAQPAKGADVAAQNDAGPTRRRFVWTTRQAHASGNGTNSHDTAFETCLSQPLAAPAVCVVHGATSNASANGTDSQDKAFEMQLSQHSRRRRFGWTTGHGARLPKWDKFSGHGF